MKSCNWLRAVLCITLMLVLVTLLSGAASAAADKRFEYCYFSNTLDPDGIPNFGEPELDALNRDTNDGNGKMLALPNDTYRDAVLARNNHCAGMYNSLTTLGDDYWNAGWTGGAVADKIRDGLVNAWPTGTPQWLLINEIHSSIWNSNSVQPGGTIHYRDWIHNIVHKLKNTYDHNVILFAPQSTGSYGGGGSWATVAADCYVGIECYTNGGLSGKNVNDNGNSVSYVQNIYSSRRATFTSAGVPSSKIYLMEAYNNNTNSENYGRGGATSSAGWHTAIEKRMQAAKNLNFPGYVTWGWHHNEYGGTQAQRRDNEFVYDYYCDLP